MVSTSLTDSDRSFLRRTLELAAGGRGQVSPNPLVGAVVVREGEVVGEGFHAKLGQEHAERAALEDCRSRGSDPAGATVYVSLEPCAHQGRQPPCAPALADAGVARVVYAANDPSRKTAGKGPALLRERGVAVEQADGEEAELARRQNQPFRKHAISGRPFVTYKCAASLDGRTTTSAGISKWISSPESRARVHEWRAESDAVGVGIGTALADDPFLNARDVGAGRQPARVVFDSAARLPLASALAGSAAESPLFVIAATDAPAERVEALRERSAEVVLVAGDGPARVAAGLVALGERDITSLLLEGGAGVAGAFLDAGEVDRLQLFMAPVLFGGETAGNIFDGVGSAGVDDAVRPISMTVDTVGADLLISAVIKEW